MAHDDPAGLVTLGQFALHTSQRGVGEKLGVSRRTVSRWMANQSAPTRAQLAQLARLVHPRDAALAARIAVAAGGTLESLGLVAPRVAAVKVASAEAIDAVVCAAADAMDVSPRAVRPALVAAFARARALGLSYEDVEKGMGAKRG